MNIFEKATQESRGQEQSILATLGRIDQEILNSHHHPCPKCGGDDRFRFNPKNGSCFCNQCFKTKKSDVVSSLAWLLDMKRNEAAAIILDHLGVKFKKPSSWRDWLEVNDWSPNFDVVAQVWANGKGVSLEAMKAAGVTWAKHKRNGGVFAFPIWNDGKISGYSMYSRSPGGTLSKWKGKGKGFDQLKVKACDGSKKGMLGQVGEVEAAETVAICEGGTDMLAAITAGYVAVSPSNGAGQKLPGWFVQMLAGKAVLIFADRDVPGDEAGKAWAQQAAAVTENVKIVELPYPLAENHGKDLRDFLADHPGKLSTLVENTDPFEPARDVDGNVEASELVEEDEELYRALKIDVVSRSGDTGAILYCHHSKNTQEVGSIDKLTLPGLITFCGPVCENWVRGPGEESPEKLSVFAVQKFLAAEISKASRDVRICGAGLWQTKAGKPVLVNGTHVISLGEKAERVESAIYEELRFQFEKEDWFDSDLFLQHYADSANVEWRTEVVRELYEWFDRWTLEHQNTQYLLAGLVMATMAQACIDWRPLVSVIGESDSGKSLLATFVAGLYGHKFFASTDEATRAGLINNFRGKSPVLVHDEWDQVSPRNRDGILQMVRTSSRSGRMVKQTFKSDNRQRGLHSEFFPVMLWLFGIKNDIEKTADLNRTIEIRVLTPEASGARDTYFRQNRLKDACMDGSFAEQIGLKLLAITSRILPSAKRLNSFASHLRLDGVPSRVIESWAVPASFLAAAWGFDEDRMESLLDRFRDIYWKSESIDIMDDATQILDVLFSSTVVLDTNQRKVLSSILQDSQSISQNQDVIQASGIRFIDRDDKQFVFVAGKHLNKNKVTEMTSRSINQVLSTVTGAKHNLQRLNGIPTKGVLIPIEHARKVIPNLCWSPHEAGF